MISTISNKYSRAARLQIARTQRRLASQGKWADEQRSRQLQLILRKRESLRKSAMEIQQSIINNQDRLMNSIAPSAVDRAVKVRIANGLAAIQQLVSSLQEPYVAGLLMTDYVSPLDKSIDEAVKTEARRILTSKFFKSLLKQLRTEQ